MNQHETTLPNQDDRRPRLAIAMLITLLCAGMTALLAMPQANAEPVAAASYYVDVYTVAISPQGVRTTSGPFTRGPMQHWSDATSVRDYYNGVPAWGTNGWRYYYTARIR